MIRHRRGEEFLLITQDDHARLSGELARHLGNEKFAPPLPAEPTIQACGLHDAGWPLHDDEPTLNAKGEPTHVFETPAEVVTRVWGESARLAAETGGPYCGLLVSLHVLNLSLMAQRGDLGNEMNTTDAHARFAVNKFQHAQIERQEEHRKDLGMRLDLPLQGGLAKFGSDPREDELRFNFGYLRLTDAISLDICSSNAVFQTLQGVHEKPGATPKPIEFAHPAPFTLNLKPWPFNVVSFEYPIPCRRITATPFASSEAFREAYNAAPEEHVALRVGAM